ARSPSSVRTIAARLAPSVRVWAGFRFASIQSNGAGDVPRPAGPRFFSLALMACPWPSSWSSSRAQRLLRGVPEAVLLGGVGVGDRAPLRRQHALDVLEALREAVDRSAQRRLGVEPQLARQVGHGQQGVTELALHLGAVAGAPGGVEL